MAYRLKGTLLISLLGAASLLTGCGGGGTPVTTPSPLMMLPFVLLLLTIAIVPLINRHWWERNYMYVSFGLGLVTVVYYLFVLGNPDRIVHTAAEYGSFVVLIGSLFVVSSGILITIRGKSDPLKNVVLLGIGAVISNLVGTTGASMILIRPYIRLNRYRIRPYHIVFFIFVVSNIGGALTPIGDPPLFLGYLKGIPFFWVAENLWYIWLLVMVIVLMVFYVIEVLHSPQFSLAPAHTLATVRTSW